MRAWWTDSGHIVVQPRINGQEVGYMILDTGMDHPPLVPCIHALNTEHCSPRDKRA